MSLRAALKVSCPRSFAETFWPTADEAAALRCARELLLAEAGASVSEISDQVISEISDQVIRADHHLHAVCFPQKRMLLARYCQLGSFVELRQAFMPIVVQELLSFRAVWAAQLPDADPNSPSIFMTDFIAHFHACELLQSLPEFLFVSLDTCYCLCDVMFESSKGCIKSGGKLYAGAHCHMSLGTCCSACDVINCMPDDLQGNEMRQDAEPVSTPMRAAAIIAVAYIIEMPLDEVPAIPVISCLAKLSNAPAEVVEAQASLILSAVLE